LLIKRNIMSQHLFGISVKGNFRSKHPCERSLGLGIVYEVVPSNKLKESALSKAREFAQKQLACYQGSKRGTMLVEDLA